MTASTTEVSTINQSAAPSGRSAPAWKTSSAHSSPISSKSPKPLLQPQPHHAFSPIDGAPYPPMKSNVSLAARRRQSRFDPMGREEEVEDEGYEEFGQRHPLRRVAEEDGKDSDGTVSLPGIKALFGVAGEHPPTPSSGGALFASPSLPSLVPNSPSSSPSTARTSRYSSFASQLSSTSDSFQMSQIPGGWWAPEFERGSMSGSSSSSPRHLSQYRANSYPTVPSFVDEHSDKRRRSDGPPALRDAEESARLRWQAQSRNASFPAVHNPPLPTSNGGTGLRSLLHPPQAASASMSRQSVSNSSGFSSPLTPFHENGGEYFERKIAPVPSRSSSLVGGQLAQSFADLTASERNERRSPLPTPNRDMGPPTVTDRRSSTLLPHPPDSSPRPFMAPLSLSRHASGGPDTLLRQSLTRPSSPEQPSRPALRRSSLTEIIMAKSGDGAAMANGRMGMADSPTSVPLEKPSLSDSPFAQPGGPMITGWPARRISADSVASAPPHISLNSDNEVTPPNVRNTKQHAESRAVDSEDIDMDLDGDTTMRGMDMLAEGASRLQEVEKENDDLEGLKGAIIPGQPGVGPKYACAFCAKTFSRPSSLRIHTYSHTGERPFVCKEPTCRRRFSVQSNLKRHAKVHQLGAQNGSVASNAAAHGGMGNGGGHPNRPIERSHRQPLPSTHHPMGHGYYHPTSRSTHPLPPPHVRPQPGQGGHHGQPSSGYPYDRYGPPHPPHQGEGRVHPPQRGHEEGWDEEEDELDEEDELQGDEGAGK